MRKAAGIDLTPTDAVCSLKDMPITERSAPSLAGLVARQSNGVSIKIGRTNGQPVLHLIRRKTEQANAASVTIAAVEAEWDAHPWNTNNQPKRDKNDATKEAQ